MFKFVLASCLALTISGQFLKSKDAKILREQRFNAGDGRFGTAYAQEDGTILREVTSADGEREGQYSYIDNDGKTITVRYTAGRDGFRILEGDHVPTGATGLTSATFNPEIALQGQHQEQVHVPAAPQARPVGRTRRPSPRARPALLREVPRSRPVHDGSFNPFINPADPSHRNLQINTNAAQFQLDQPQQPAQTAFQPQQQRFQQQQFQPQQQRFQQQQQFQPQPQQQRFQQQQQQFQQQQPQRQPEPFNSAKFAASVPACAGCEGLNPFINPADESHAQLFQQQFRQPAQPTFRQPAQPSFRQPAQPTFRQPAQPTFRQPAQPTFQQSQQAEQQFFRFPSQPAQQAIQPAFLQQQQQPARQQQFFQQQQQQQQQQQFQPQQQLQQQQFQQQQQQPSAAELAHLRKAQAQIQEAVRLQNCLANPTGC